MVISSRLLVGLLFIFSGLIKANDPLGFAYKLEEYFIVFDMMWFTSLSLFLAMFICILEIVLGVAVLVGVKMRFFTLLLLLMIIFFTWLTGYSAITGEVTDCGCFGDAIKLKPVGSFIKDLILLFFILIVYLKRKSVHPISKSSLPNILLGISFVLITIFTVRSYFHLPIKDFRPYKIGNNIPELMVCPEGSPVDEYQVIYTLIHVETGETKKVTDKEYLTEKIWEDKNWEINSDKTVSKLIVEGCKPPIHDFSISTDGNDITDSKLQDENFSLWVIAYDLDNSNVESFKEINILAGEMERSSMGTFLLTSTSNAEQFRHENGAAYPFYNTDVTTLKTIIRSNPGLLLVKGGTIMGKWHYNDIPTIEELQSEFPNLR